MDTKNLKNVFESRKITKAIYPALSTIFIILVAVLFTFAVKTISKLINDTVSESPAQTSPFSVDQENFTIVANKLGVPKEAEGMTVTQATTTEVAIPAVTLDENPATTTETIMLDPRDLKIEIYNGTTIKGGAAQLKKILEEKNFVIANTGNATTLSSKTILRIKKSRDTYLPIITTALGSAYAPDEVIQDIPESEHTDVIITIGHVQ